MSRNIDKSVDLGFKMADAFLTGTTTLFDVMERLLKYASKDPTAKLLNKYIESGGSLDFTICRPEHTRELQEKLENAGIVFMHTTSMANGGVNMFVYADKDRERVNQILNEFRSEHNRHGLTDKYVLEAYANGQVVSMQGLNMYEMLLFKEQAEREKIMISLQETQKGQYTLFYAKKDKNLMDRIKTDVALSLCGNHGKTLKKQLQYENAKIAKFCSDIQCYNNKEPINLVDLSGNHMTMDEFGVSFKGNDGVEITLERNEFRFEEQAIELLMRMRGPVELTDEQFAEFENSGNKKKYLSEIDKEHGRPEITKEEYEDLLKLKLTKELYYIKLDLLYPEQSANHLDIENDEMRMATFEEFNDLNIDKFMEENGIKDIDPQILHELKIKLVTHLRDVPVSFDHKQDKLEDIVLNGKNIDMEEWAKDKEEWQKEMDMDYDIDNDENANRIDDEFER